MSKKTKLIPADPTRCQLVVMVPCGPVCDGG